MPKSELIYRGTHDGFDYDVANAVLINRGATLTLIETEFGFVFGAYTSKTWLSGNNWQEDEEAFIFSLTYMTLHTPYRYKESANRHR